MLYGVKNINQIFTDGVINDNHAVVTGRKRPSRKRKP